MSDQPWVTRFAETLYPGYAEAALMVASEESLLTDASDLIEQLRMSLRAVTAERDSLREKLEAAQQMRESLGRISLGLTLPEDDVQRVIRMVVDEAIASYDMTSSGSGERATSAIMGGLQEARERLMTAERERDALAERLTQKTALYQATMKVLANKDEQLAAAESDISDTLHTTNCSTLAEVRARVIELNLTLQAECDKRAAAEAALPKEEK